MDNNINNRTQAIKKNNSESTHLSTEKEINNFQPSDSRNVIGRNSLLQMQAKSDQEQANRNKLPENWFKASELINRGLDKIPTLLDPILPQFGLCGLAGSSDTGKSSFLRQLALSVCQGDKEFLGFKLNTRHKDAIYVVTEDDDHAIAHLLYKSNLQKNLPPDKYDGLTFVFDTYQLIKKLDSRLKKHKADLIIIDAFTDLYGNSMNDTNQVRTFLNEYSQLAQKHKCLIIFLHHTGKRTDELAPSKHNLLGSQGFEAKMRLVIILRNDSIEPDKKHLCIVKGNYLPKEYKTESYILQFDNNLQFHNTNKRTPFEELVESKNSRLQDQVTAAHQTGMGQVQIAKKFKISQSTVCRYLKK